MLLQETKPLTAEQKELLAMLDAGTSHVVLIVEDILLHGALLSGNFPVVSEPLTLSAAVLEPALTTLALQPALRDKLRSMTLTRQVASDVPPMVLGDATRLLQVVINLLGNAVKFTPSGGRVQLALEASRTAPSALPPGAPRADEWLCFRVTDTGVGVPPDKLARIFLPFTQADLSTVRKFGGTVRRSAHSAHLQRTQWRARAGSASHMRPLRCGHARGWG
jgi:signal transduction histidine kinase